MALLRRAAGGARDRGRSQCINQICHATALVDLRAQVAQATKTAVAEVRELEAVKRAASRPVDPRAAIAFRVPEACFVRVARFLYHAPRPPPTPPPLDAGILGLLEGFVRRPPPPV